MQRFLEPDFNFLSHYLHLWFLLWCSAWNLPSPVKAQDRLDIVAKCTVFRAVSSSKEVQISWLSRFKFKSYTLFSLSQIVLPAVAWCVAWAPCWPCPSSWRWTLRSWACRPRRSRRSGRLSGRHDGSADAQCKQSPLVGTRLGEEKISSLSINKAHRARIT